MTCRAARATTARGVSYVRRGAGAPVLLLHGWCLDSTLWAYEEDLLAEDHEVLVPDLPGFGRSDGVAEPYDMAGHVAAMTELLAETDLEDVLVVGFAFGAAVALTLAASRGTGIAGVVAVGVPSRAVFRTDRMVRAIRRDWPEFARRSAQVLCGSAHSTATVDWIERSYGSTPLRSALQGARLLGQFDPGPPCGEIDVPVLFVHGRDDKVVPVEVARDCVAATQRGRLEVLADCGHLVVLDQRDALHQAILGFERELTRPGAR